MTLTLKVIVYDYVQYRNDMQLVSALRDRRTTGIVGLTTKMMRAALNKGPKIGRPVC